jgi:hypothetical protein
MRLENKGGAMDRPPVASYEGHNGERTTAIPYSLRRRVKIQRNSKEGRGIHRRTPFITIRNKRERETQANTKSNNVSILQKTTFYLKWAIAHYQAM